MAPHAIWASLLIASICLVDLELSEDDSDVLNEIQESNRGEQHSQLRVDSLSLTLPSRSHGQSVEQVEMWRVTIGV